MDYGCIMLSKKYITNVNLERLVLIKDTSVFLVERYY